MLRTIAPVTEALVFHVMRRTLSLGHRHYHWATGSMPMGYCGDLDPHEVEA